jgi:hypothetical protein
MAINPTTITFIYSLPTRSECYYYRILKALKYSVLRSVTIKKKVDGNK